jgi:hypothetical protein
MSLLNVVIAMTIVTTMVLSSTFHAPTLGFVDPDLI